VPLQFVQNALRIGGNVFHWLRGKQDEALFAGVSLHADGVAGAVLRAMPDGGVSVENVCWHPLQGDASVLELVPEVIKACDASQVPLTAVLAPDSYSLVQIEKPDLPEEELHDALRWRIKDMVDFPVQDAVFDSFALPKSLRPGAPELAYVVAVPKETIDQLADTLEKRCTQVRAIDVPELSLRDLVMHTGVDGRIHAYLYLQPAQALIEISGGDEVFITRRIPMAEDLLALQPEQQLQAMEPLVLEVQRSLDYFESQYGRGAVDQLFVLSASEAAEHAFIHSATLYLTVPVAGLSLDAMQGVEKIEQQTLRNALLALGAAMREMPCVA
jgi:MSHA biogenesis protein MshI